MMTIKLHEITIAELFDGFFEDEENGIVLGYHGMLNMRPVYQREFIYKDEQKKAVIRSVQNKFPLNVMYWVKIDENTYELLDGQQRSISICQYINGDYSVNEKAFHSLRSEEQNAIKNYKLMVYICEGTDQDILDWFEVINIVGKPLKNQEIRNAIYHGPWVSSARSYFSKRNCVGYKKGANYLDCEWDRQIGLETALLWIIDSENRKIEKKQNDTEKYTIRSYMSFHQYDENAKDLWDYFSKVIDWVESVFPHYRKIMKGLPWGVYYNAYGDKFSSEDAEKLEKRIVELVADKQEITKMSGIYEYLMDGDERHLSLRQFNDNEKAIMYEKQKGICKICGKHFEIEEMQGDHIIPWSKGGRTVLDNCQMLCTKCNREKSNQY